MQLPRTMEKILLPEVVGGPATDMSRNELPQFPAIFLPLKLTDLLFN